MLYFDDSSIVYPLLLILATQQGWLGELVCLNLSFSIRVALFNVDLTLSQSFLLCFVQQFESLCSLLTWLCLKLSIFLSQNSQSFLLCFQYSTCSVRRVFVSFSLWQPNFPVLSACRDDLELGKLKVNCLLLRKMFLNLNRLQNTGTKLFRIWKICHRADKQQITRTFRLCVSFK